MKRLSILAPLVALVLILAACGDSSDDSTEAAPAADTPTEEAFSFGAPADPADATRTIDVVLTEFAFDPSTIKVSDGEVVTFRLRNEGTVEHDFTIGDQETQDEHDAEMAEATPGEEHMADPNAVTVEPGETAELTWRFENVEGEIQFGCHVPGHYAAGMVGQFEQG